MNKLPHFVTKVCLAAASVALTLAPARAETETLTKDMRFCPSWAEAHERTLASLNGGRPPYPVKWKGCIVVKRGTQVDVIDHDDQSTENPRQGKALVRRRVNPRSAILTVIASVANCDTDQRLPTDLSRPPLGRDRISQAP